jgi:hypothetical protein
MIPKEKIYSEDTSEYTETSVSKRIEALLLNNVGLIVTRDQIIDAARDPKTGQDPENWHQRLSELRTDKGYTILSSRDWSELRPQEYILASTSRRAKASRRVLPTPATWKAILHRANHACEWGEDGQKCGLEEGSIDPIGGGTVKLTPDHTKPHSVDPNSDPTDTTHWQALCGRHQVMKKNFWDGTTGKINLIAVLQAASLKQKRAALDFLERYFGISRS